MILTLLSCARQPDPSLCRADRFHSMSRDMILIMLVTILIILVVSSGSGGDAAAMQ